MPLSRSGERCGETQLWIARAGAVALFLVALTVIAYTVVTDGSPFRAELLTPWMAATLVDFYGLVAFIAIVIAMVEPVMWQAVMWILAVICLGSIGLWAWVAKQLFLRAALGEPVWAWLAPGAASASGSTSGFSPMATARVD